MWVSRACARTRFLAASLTGLLTLVHVASAQGAAEDERLAERDRQVAGANRLLQEGEIDGALRELERVLSLEREVFGAAHEEVAETLETIARLHGARGDLAAVCVALGEALTVRSAVHGAEHWKTTDARLALEDARRWAAFSGEQRQALQEAVGLDEAAYRHWRAGRIDEALDHAERSLAIRRALLGRHRLTVKSCRELGALHAARGDPARAEALYREALAIQEEILGKRHPDRASGLRTLARLYWAAGAYADAEPLLLEALEVARAALGPSHPDVGAAMLGLATLYDDMGRWAKAEPLYRQVLEALPADHPDHAATLNNLAGLYRRLGLHDEAKALYLKALAIWKGARGRDYAGALSSLGALEVSTGAYAEAEAHFREAIEIRRGLSGEENPEYATYLSNLACVLDATGRLEEAEALHRRALEITRQALGESHPACATRLNNLAHLFAVTGRLAQAESLFLASLEVRRAALGERHPDYAASLRNLGLLYPALGQHGRAAALLREALSVRRDLLDAAFAVLSERQQLTLTRSYRDALDAFVEVAPSAGVDPAETYAALLPWKGAVFARQARARVVRDDPENAALRAAYEDTCRRLATACLSPPAAASDDGTRDRTQALFTRKDELERELSARSAAFREVRAAERLTPAHLQAAMPEGTVLFDFLEYGCGSGTRKLAVFVVPHDGGIRRVDLGPVPPIAEAVEAWRTSLRERRASEAGARLRALVWEPLLAQVEGARTVLLSPDGVLHRLSFPALPGSRAGTYLLEDMRLAVVAVPQLLPRLLADSRPAGPGLLLVGDPAFGEFVPASGMPRSAAAAPPARRLLPLGETRAEIEAIHRAFAAASPGSRVAVLLGEDATEAAFRGQASASRWIHVATHGIFAPPRVRSALAGEGDERGGPVGFHPGQLSGLALAHANLPAEPGADDGVLTALEVVALDLRGVECVVLSACDTGLGDVAAGEGVFGLQRAFQVAGAGTTIASLWRVSDRHTNLLMQHFYANLWTRGCGKLDALREAQLRILREGPRADATGASLPPYFWAAFVLSGDWR